MARHRGEGEGIWLDDLLSRYRPDERVGAKRRGERLAKADTAQRLAGLEEGVELLHEGLDEFAEMLTELEREFAKPFPNKARLHRLLWWTVPYCVIDNIAAMRRDLRRWTARGRAADKRALASWRPVLNAADARLDDLCERYLLIERRIEARFARDDLMAAFDDAFERYLRSIGATGDEDDELFERHTRSFLRTIRIY